MMIRSQVKEILICGLLPFFTAETVKMALGGHVIQNFTANIDILAVNTIICHYNPHKSYKLFDFVIFMAVLVV